VLVGSRVAAAIPRRCSPYEVGQGVCDEKLVSLLFGLAAVGCGLVGGLSVRFTCDALFP
jgi:hypothetical protein